MRLFLCEKPSQGRDIARVVGANKRGEGCLLGDGIGVTWCIGHLLETAPPEAYDPRHKTWALENLPIIPAEWKVEIKPKTSAQFKVIKKLLRDASELIIATDADREGELIAREVLDYCGYRGPVQRLWLSALNPQSVRKALSELMPGSATILLYQAALARSRADWLIGMNLSRLFTLLARRGGADRLLTVGRVQTPTLNLVVKRHRAITSFVSKPFWEVKVQVQAAGKDFMAQWLPPTENCDDADRCVDRTAAENAKQMLSTGTARVQSVLVNFTRTHQ
jgi:DNA topoisomerase-3